MSKRLNVSSVDWGGFTSDIHAWDPLLNSHVCFAFFLWLFLITILYSAGDSRWTSCGRAAIWCWVFQEVPQSEYCSVSKNVRKGKSLFLCSPFMSWVWVRASVTGSHSVSYSHHFAVLWISVCALTSVWRKIWIPPPYSESILKCRCLKYGHLPNAKASGGL